jgi:hypothetical protein
MSVWSQLALCAHCRSTWDFQVLPNVHLCDFIVVSLTPQHWPTRMMAAPCQERNTTTTMP